MNQDKQSIYVFLFLFIIGFFLIIKRSTGPSSEITEEDLMDHIRYLSHPNREGRIPGSRGSKDVVSYLVKNFKSYGLKPGNRESFVQPFDIKTGIELDGENLLMINNDSLFAGKDYIPLSFSASGFVTGEVVFAGYGFNISDDNLEWNDYSKLDVAGKWVVVMRHSPERNNQHSLYSSHSSLHKKMLVARDAGAIGVVFISQIEDEELYPLKYAAEYNNVGIPAIHLSNSRADKFFKNLGWSRKKIQEKMNKTLQPLSFEINNVVIASHININPTTTRAANVIATIRSGNRKYRDEYIVIGAHFDHLGKGGVGSGSREPNSEETHPGANDNASGIAGLLELAQKLAAKKNKLKRSILFIAFDAEEKGLLGSKKFIESSEVDLGKITSMVNMDMIGRMKDSTATVGGVGTSPSFSRLIDSLKINRPFKLIMNNPGFGPSDHAVFYANDIPVLFFFTGFHDEYHTPKDTWKLINLPGTKNLVDLIYDIVVHLARSNERLVFSESGPKTGQMGAPKSFKVTLGIMPSYGSEKEGVEVAGISNLEGPAAEAGVKKGDVIKSINDKTIKNIYEYMDRLSELKSGMGVPLTLERNGKTITLQVVL